MRVAAAAFNTLADTAPVMIWMSGIDKGCTYFNQPWLRFTGRSLAQELGNGWADGVHPDDLAPCLARYVAAFDARQPFTLEYRLRRADGAYRWILDNGAPLYDGAGGFEGYIGCCTDVSDLREAVAARRESESRLHQIVEHIDASVWLHDVASRELLYLSRAAERLFGFTTAELRAEPWRFLQRVHRDDRDRIAARMQQDPDYVLEYRVHSPRGLLWLETSSYGVRDESGAVVRVVGISHEITEQKGVEAALRTSEGRLRALLDCAADAILGVDQDGAIVSTNRAAERVFGTGSAALVDGSLQDVLHVAWPPRVAAGQSLACESIGRRTDGSWFPTEVGLSASGDPQHPLYTLIVRDVSERRHLEHLAIETADTLQRRIGQDLHDGLGQVLTGLALMVRDVQEQVPDVLRAKVTRIGDLIADALSRTHDLAQGLAPFHLENVELRDALKNLAAEVTSTFNFGCTVVWAQDVPEPEAHEKLQLYLIAQEAVTNAVRHSGGSRIWIQLGLGEEGRCMRIRDNGRGVEGGRGAGLGLTSMAHRARMIGGRLATLPALGGGFEVRCDW